MNPSILQPIHTSVRVLEVERKATELRVRSSFRVILDRSDVPRSGVGQVLTFLYTTVRAQMLKAYWVPDPKVAEAVVAKMPHPQSIFTREGERVCKAMVMPEKDWDKYREEWVAMNDADPG